MITVCFTNGWVSVKRGRITRKYTPNLASARRLGNVLSYGASEHTTTNRSSIYTWHGMSTLTPNQRAMLCLLEYARDTHIVQYFLGVKDACIAGGIHPVLIELVTPCEHGKARSRCYTCYTLL